MKIKRVISGALAAAMAVVMATTTIPVYAYVSGTKNVSGYGTLKGWQEDLYEQDYNEICWVNIKTSITEWEEDTHTIVKYQPLDTATGVALDPEVRKSNDSWLCTATCYISDYGFYEDTGDVSLFSTHEASGQGYCSAIYLKDVY